VTRSECPRCGKASSNPYDLAEGYCGRCHDWTGRIPDEDVLRIIREGHAKTARLTDANFHAVHRLSGELRMSYEEALNYVVELGLGMTRSLKAVRAARKPEEAE